MLRSAAVVLVMACAAWAQQSSSPAPATLEDVRWMVGCWSGEMAPGRRYEECWTVPAGGSMQGSARITRPDRTTFREFMLLEQEGEHVVLTVQHFGARMAPQGPTVSFSLVRASECEAVFENPQHDHPQRIAYRRLAEGGIRARIENLDGSRPVEFPMGRKGATAPCPAADE